MAGAVTLLARHGKVIDTEGLWQERPRQRRAHDHRHDFPRLLDDQGRHGRGHDDSVEEGKWNPQDPISKYIPEFAHLKVFKGVDADGKMLVEDPVHPPTMHELMTHTAGFTYGLFLDGPVDKTYQSARRDAVENLQEMIDKLANIPLLYQPGTKWVYSVSMDIQGYIVEKLSGQSLPDFMHEHIFAPLENEG